MSLTLGGDKRPMGVFIKESRGNAVSVSSILFPPLDPESLLLPH